MPPLIVAPALDGALIVSFLGSLVAAAQQRDNYSTFTREVDPIAGAGIDAQFADAIAKLSLVPKVALLQAQHPAHNGDPPLPIPQAVDPGLIKVVARSADVVTHFRERIFA